MVLEVGSPVSDRDAKSGTHPFPRLLVCLKALPGFRTAQVELRPARGGARVSC